MDNDLLKKYLNPQDIMTPPFNPNPQDQIPLDAAAAPKQEQMSTPGAPSPSMQAEIPQPKSLDLSDFKDPELEAAIEEKKKTDNLASFLSNLNTIGTAVATRGARSAKELGTDDFSGLQKQGDYGVQSVLEKRKAADANMDRQQKVKDLQSVAEQNDPNSRRSQLARDLFSKASGLPTEQLSKMSEAEITRNFPFMDKIVQRQVDREKESRLAEQNKLERDYKEKELQVKSDQAKAELASKREIARQASEDRRLAQQQANELKQLLLGHKLDSEEDKKNERAAKEARLSDKQVESLSNNAKAISALDNIMEQKKKWDTGPISMGQNKLASMVGLDDPEKSAFKSDVGEELATYIKGISGATVSPTERAALLANVPSVYDNDKTFEAKAKALKKRLSNLNDVETQYLKKQGKNTKEFETDSGNRSTAGQEQPRSNMVKMRTPDGVLHSVPSDKVEEAKKRGAKLE